MTKTLEPKQILPATVMRPTREGWYRLKHRPLYFVFIRVRPGSKRAYGVALNNVLSGNEHYCHVCPNITVTPGGEYTGVVERGYTRPRNGLSDASKAAKEAARDFMARTRRMRKASEKLKKRGFM